MLRHRLVPDVQAPLPRGSMARLRVIVTIQAIGENLEKEIKTLKGTRTVVAERIASGYFLDVDFDREKLKAYGLSLKDAQDQAMVAIGRSMFAVKAPLEFQMHRFSVRLVRRM